MRFNLAKIISSACPAEEDHYCMNQENTRARFIAIAGSAEDEILIDEAALVIAAETDTSVNIEGTLRKLDDMADRFEHGSGNDSENNFYGVSVSRLVDFIHVKEGFTGNVRDYYDPTNSYLNRVIEHKVGIPITLAIVHIALGNRLNIPVSGINFPGHFLVKYGAENRLLIDPFSGRILSEPDCGTLLKQIAGPKATLQPHYFEAASNKDVLIRMLDNLKQIFWRNKQWQESLQCIERQELLRPAEDEYSVQRGAVYEMQGNLSLAQHTYAHIVQKSDDEQARELASKRLLAMGHSSSTTVH